MSIVFGEIRQIAYITRDIEAAMRFLVRSCGIGPWFVAERMLLKNYRYRGAPHELEMSVALANSGSLQIEIIQPTNDAPSMYRDWLARHPTGDLVHHFSSWSERYEETLAKAQARGFRVVMEGRSGYGPFVYMEHPDNPDLTFEVTEFSAPRRIIFGKVAAAAAGWDGSDPIRRSWPDANP